MIILVIVFFVIAIIFIVIAARTSSTIYTFWGIASIVITIAFIYDFHIKIPKAIDVYQGKTTLQITYRDGVPIDSVVVFKTK